MGVASSVAALDVGYSDRLKVAVSHVKLDQIREYEGTSVPQANRLAYGVEDYQVG